MISLPVAQPEAALAQDFSSLSTAASCLRKYYWQYVRRLEEPGENVPMKGGTAIHAAFEVLYGGEWDLPVALDAMRESYRGFRPPPASKHSYLTEGHLEIALTRYFEDRSERPTILEEASVAGSGVEGAVVFDWPNAEGEIVRIGGKPDLPIQTGSQRWIVDHKATTGYVNRWWAKSFSVSHQFRIYVAAMRHLFALEFDGAYVNGIHIGPNAVKEPGYWKGVKSSPNALFGPFNYGEGHLEETWSWVKEWTEIIEGRDVEDPASWPQNERACGDYGGCAYLPLCELPPAARASRARTHFVEWEPEGILLSGADSDD